MNFTLLLGLSFVVFLIGLLYRLSAWFSQGIRPSSALPASATKIGNRVASAVKAVFGVLFSAKILLVLKALVVDLLFQTRVFERSLLRWLAHSLIFFGFILLLLMHGLGASVSEALFSGYQSTQSPYLLLRNLFGLMVLAGVGIAVFRRITLKAHRMSTSPSDWTALVLVGLIALSGMLYEGAKMSSYTVYQGMVEEWGSFSEDGDQQALEAFWIKENGLVSPNLAPPVSPELVARGREVHGESCIECHSSNRLAFASYGVASLTRPVTAAVGDAAAVSLFRWLHLLSCLALLAWLPFSKMFHILSAPLSLIIKRVTGDSIAEPTNILTSQMIGLSACTHCGTCSLACSSGMFYEKFGNDFILPSEKVQYLKRFAAGKEQDPGVVKRMQEGLYVCTSCDRCTTLCPSGINLKELFVSSRYSLLETGKPETTILSHFSFPLALAENFADDHRQALRKVTALFKKSFQHLADLTGPITLAKGKTIGNDSYRACYACQRCSNICPVVRSYDQPLEALGMLPHQIIFSLGIGNVELAMGAQMIWSCSTCYLCQEHCPNKVELCDIFYTLKNKAIHQLDAGASA